MSNDQSASSKPFRIFVSLPFTGREDTLGERYESGLKWVGKWSARAGRAAEAVAQSNISQLIKDRRSVPDNQYARYMGEDVASVIQSDGILMCEGWRASKGCSAELAIAEAFGKRVFYELPEQLPGAPALKRTTTWVVNDSGHPLPVYAKRGDAGMDLRAWLPDGNPVRLQPGERKLIGTGLRMALPEGVELQIRSRSGLALRFGVVVLNSPGTVDSGYRDEIKVLLTNFGSDQFIVEDGDRIAQGVFAEYLTNDFRETLSLDLTTDRGGGWGTSGVK